MLGLAFQAVKADDNQGVTVSKGLEGRVWQLQASQVSLPSVLQEVQRATGVAIHYSVLPQALVSATCVSEKLPALLKCLLGDGVGLVFDRANASEPKEVWVLGSSSANHTSDCKSELVTGQQASDSTDIKALHEGVRSSDPRRRAQAIYALAITDDKEAEAILREGMIDSSALVRGQAVGGWVRRYGAEAAESELQDAILDVDASVRMQAIELTSNPSLLSQGLQDSDTMVRQLAQAKLDELMH